MLKRCDSPWRLRISPSARGLTSDGDRRFGFHVRMVLRGSCRCGLFMLDRLPDHMELTSQCAWSTSSIGTSGTRLNRSKMGLRMLWLCGRMVRARACSFQPLPSRTCSRISRCTAPLVHTAPADGWVSARTCMSARVGVAVATMRLRALAGCVTRLQEAGTEQSCSPGRREADVQRALARTLQRTPYG